MRRKKNHTGRRVAVGRSIFGLDQRQIGLRWQAVETGEVTHDLSGLVAVSIGHVLALAEIDRSVDALRIDAHRIALNDRDAAGERRLAVLNENAVLSAPTFSLCSMPPDITLKPEGTVMRRSAA